MSDKASLFNRHLTGEILDSFFAVYNALGYGFLERVYANALSLELRNRWIRVDREVPCDVQYLGQPVGHFRMDMVVAKSVIIEVKAGAAIGTAEVRQLFNYLRSSAYPVGLLLHFGPRPEFKRFVDTKLRPGMRPSAVSASPASSA